MSIDSNLFLAHTFEVIGEQLNDNRCQLGIDSTLNDGRMFIKSLGYTEELLLDDSWSDIDVENDHSGSWSPVSSQDRSTFWTQDFDIIDNPTIDPKNLNKILPKGLYSVPEELISFDSSEILDSICISTDDESSFFAESPTSIFNPYSLEFGHSKVDNFQTKVDRATDATMDIGTQTEVDDCKSRSSSSTNTLSKKIKDNTAVSSSSSKKKESILDNDTRNHPSNKSLFIPAISSNTFSDQPSTKNVKEQIYNARGRVRREVCLTMKASYNYDDEEEVKAKRRRPSIVHKSRNGKLICTLEDCNREFTNRALLSRHINCVHLRLERFSCSHCVKKFTRSDHLKIHVQRMHSPSCIRKRRKSSN
ncbi:hypothetical protein CANARDRAFT_24617 [[Candida] arabinofermentans NRRL YB-2248]|uniref:C2H2-type domain-containing protein n=1 Tax=[Candida] arabinofermentans NRRL YB-2248 TaxID=983967 RepID=A0A1E4SWS6_9ASCO|nr:hypothetical protein CANARDRAFT_24617 [[Candida] arabinofermentans NRRL YB-2248]